MTDIEIYKLIEALRQEMHQLYFHFPPAPITPKPPAPPPVPK